MLEKSTIPVVSEGNFEQEVMRSELPVLVDLFADWCAPCRTLSPRVEQVAKEYAGKLKVVKVNTDHSPRIAQAFRAQSIPMLVLISGGKIAGSLQGAVSKEEIIALIEPVVGSNSAPDMLKPAELAKLIAARRVLVIDVRERAPYARAHIPGAIQVLATELIEKLPELAQQRKPVIVYDRSHGDDAKAALEALHAQNFPAGALEGGFLAWEGEGLDVERAN